MLTVVNLFGPPEVTRDGTPQHPDTRKALAVLAYLAVEGPTASRDRLAWMLWPESSQERARATLRRTLTSLRSAVGADALSATRESITLDLDAVHVDAARFHTAVGDGDHHLAASLYRGEFLQGFSLRDAPDFDDWQRLEADGFRTRVDAALAFLADAAIAAGTPTEAADHALRRIELNGLNEEARRSLMLIYAQLGRRADAVAAYRDLVRTLDEELGVAPLPVTADLYEAIRRGEVTVSTRAPATPIVTSPPTEIPLVGRDAELARFDARLASGRGGAIRVVGGRGTGKTTLLSEIERRALAERRPVVMVRCFEGERSLAYAPVAELLRTALGDAEPDQELRLDVGRLMAEHRRPGDDEYAASTDGPGSRLRLFDAWATALAASGLEGGVLIVDDTQLADEASQDFLAYLANRAEARRLTLVTASETVAPLKTAPGMETLELSSVPDGTGLPDLETELRDLDASARQLLEAAAVIDRAFDLDLLRSVAGRSTDQVAETADRLIAGAILVAGPGETIGLAHPTLRDSVYAHTSAVRRRLLHRRAGDALEHNEARRGEAAVHYEAAGVTDRAAELHVAAARHAMATFANRHALTHVRSALSLGHEDRAALHEMSGDLEALEGRYRDALQSYEIAAAIGTPDTLSRVEYKLGLLALRRGDPAAALSHLASALAELGPAAGTLRAQILTAQASAEERSGHLDVAAEVAAEAVAVAENTTAETEAAAQCVAGGIALSAGSLDEAGLKLRSALRLAEVGRSSAAAAAAHNGLGLLSVRRSDFDVAVGHFEAAIALLERQGDRHRLAAALSNLADAHHEAGRDRESMKAMEGSSELLADIGGDPLEGQAGVWSLTSW